MDILTMVGIAAGTSLAGVVGGMAYNLALAAWRQWERYKTDVAGLQAERLAMEQAARRDATCSDRVRLDLDRERVKITQQVWPDANGKFPLLWNGQCAINPNLGFILSDRGVESMTPEVMIPEQKRRLLEAMPEIRSEAVAQQVLEAGEPDPLPARIDLMNIFRDRRPTLENLVVGVANDRVVSLPLHRLMHTLAVGASGWGKSTWLRSLLWQVAKSSEPVEVIAIDLSGTELNACHDWSKLRYPVAREPDDAIAVLQTVDAELTRRKLLFEPHPLATNLVEYNQLASENLPPWLVIIDEGTTLLNRPGMQEPLREAVQRARQYGIYVIVAGQTAKADNIPTEIRDQFSSRLAFRTSPSSSRAVIDSSDANKIRVHGRALAVLSGQEIQELQGPFVSREQFLDAMTGGGPRYAMPEMREGVSGGRSTKSVDADKVREILELYSAGESDTAIARQVFGHGNMHYIDKVREILSNNNNTSGHDNANGVD